MTARAACAGLDPESWFDEDPETHKVLARVCASCPVRAACDQTAKSMWPDVYGFWAGRWYNPERKEKAA